MKNYFIKKCPYIILASCIFFLTSVKPVIADFVTEDAMKSKTSSSNTIAPRSAMRIEMSTSVDNKDEINGYEEIEVTVKWLEAMPIKEPVRLEATNDAAIMVETIDDIVFETNGIQKDISDLIIEEGYIKFMTGAASRGSICTLSYKVRAPIASGQFKLSAKIAADNAMITNSNYIETLITVTSGLTVETTHNTIYSDTLFEVFGQLNYRTQSENPDLAVSMDVYNKNTGEMVYELTGASYPTNNNYSIGSFTFPDFCEDGEYVIVVTLADGWNIIGSASKVVNYMKFPLTVESSVDIVNGQSPFTVFGLIKYRSAELNPDILISLDVYNKETEEMVYELTGADYPTDFSYKIDNLIFPESCENGTYVLYLTIVDGMNIIGSATKEISYIK